MRSFGLAAISFLLACTIMAFVFLGAHKTDKRPDYQAYQIQQIMEGKAQ